LGSVRQDDLPAERIRHALLEELRSVRAVGEIGRFANRAIAGDELDVPVRRLAILAFGVAVRALKTLQIPGGCGPYSGVPDLRSG
jgi:hypothetical protein